MGKTLYAKSDGNGGFVISKAAMALISVLIAVMSSIVAIVAYSVNVRADVDTLKERYDKIEVIVENSHAEEIRISEKLDNIREDLVEIKADIKEVNGKLDEHLTEMRAS